MNANDVQRAIEFVHREGRVLERAILQAAFEGAAPDRVAAALRGYRNDDGGFGYGLEPDKRTPTSQPLDVEVAWQSLDWAGLTPAELIEPACDYLAAIGPGVSCVNATVTEHPHALHWSDASYEPTLNPTASLAGYLWKWRIEHPWRAAATDFCWSILSHGSPDDAHSAICVLKFLEHVDDRERANISADELRLKLPALRWLQYDASSDDYGVTPLQLVPDPRSPLGDLFPADIVNRHLDFLEETQGADGGWDLTWPTIGPAAVSEWRGRRTVENLLVLRAYGRIR